VRPEDGIASDALRRFPQIPDREGEHPESKRAGRHDQNEEALVGVDCFGGGGGDADERDREDEKERTERGPRRRRGHGRTLERPRIQSPEQPLGA